MMQQWERRGRSRTGLALAVTLLMIVPTVLAGGTGPESTDSPGDDASAEATCTPVIESHPAHAPVGTWTSHAHPLFQWFDECAPSRYHVVTSWGDEFVVDDSFYYHPTLPDGEHEIAVRSEHWYLHCHPAWPCYWHRHYYWSGWTVLTVLIDTTGPDVGVTVGEPRVVDAGTTFVTDGTPFTLHASDPLSGLERMEKAADGDAWESYAGPFDLRGRDDGAHTVHYRAIDHAGASTAKTLGVVVDATPPVIEFLYPTPNSVTFGRFGAESCSENPRVKVGEESIVEVERPGDVSPPPAVDRVASERPAPCEGVLLATTPVARPLPDTGHEDVPTEVQADAHRVAFDPPVVMTGLVEIKLDVRDSTVGTDAVRFLVDGVLKEEKAAGDGVYRFRWDTTRELAGEHVLTVRAIDRLGTAGESSFTVTVLPQSADGFAGTLAEVQKDAESARSAAVEAACVALGEASGFVHACRAD